jgi:putative transposase
MRHPLHDYTQAAGYFITTVTSKRSAILGTISHGVFTASNCGKMVQEIWTHLPEYFPGLTLDAFQLMPDHVHCIMIISHLPASDGNDVKRYGLPRVMQSFKSMSARRINLLRDTLGRPVWQEGYIDRIIRNEGELEKYRNYIINNPLRTILER